MKLFIDTANIEEIKKTNEMGIISGVTTNPTLIAKEGKDFFEAIKEIASIVDGPISAEVIGETADKMVPEGEALAKIHGNIVIKVPMTAEGLKAVKIFSEKGIKTNVTLIFSAAQALLASNAGASYVSPFVGRLDDIGANGVDLVREIAEIFEIYNLDTQIIAASIRNSAHIIDCARCGADIATVPYAILTQMVKHPLTDSGIERFLADWKAANNI